MMKRLHICEINFSNFTGNEYSSIINNVSYFSFFSRSVAPYCQESVVWTEVNWALLRESPTLFDSFNNPDDVLIHLAACAVPPIWNDYVDALAKYYQNHPDSFQKHVSQVLALMEKIIVEDNLKAAEFLMEKSIIRCFNSITNHEELLQMFIRLCSSVRPTSRDYFCRCFISPLTYELSNKKFPKKLALLSFDLLLTILDLHIMQAPNCTYRLIGISEFYPWKQLNKQITHLIQSCIAYDTVTCESGQELENITQIISLIHERAKVNTAIFQATHDVALQAILKWSVIVDINTGRPYPKHAFTMGEVMTRLIEEEKVTADICIQLVDALQKRIENDDESRTNYCPDDMFLIVSVLRRLIGILSFSLKRIAGLIPQCMKHMPKPPIILHEKIAAVCLAAFACPFTTESGAATFAQSAAVALWFNVISFLRSEEEATVYEGCADRLHQLVYNEGDESFHSWWITYWCIIGTKYPNVAVKGIPQLLEEAIDHKKFDLTSILSVN